MEKILKIAALVVLFLGVVPAWITLWALLLIQLQAGPALWITLILYLLLSGLVPILQGVAEGFVE